MPESDESINVGPIRPDDPWYVRHAKFILYAAGRITLNVVLMVIIGFMVWVAGRAHTDSTSTVTEAFKNITQQVNAGHKEARDDFKKELEVRDKVGDTVMSFMKEEQKTSRETIGLLQQQHATSKELLNELRGQRQELKNAVKGRGE